MKNLDIIVAALMGLIIGILSANLGTPEYKPCRPEAIASIESKDGLSCIYQHPLWGVARRVEK